MFAAVSGVRSHAPGFPLKPLPFSQFVPMLYNMCISKANMRHGLIMPGRAFCSDGSQGYPSMLLAKHFGTWPFDFGMLGGTLDFNRASAFVSHGQDLVIVQATHVGFDEAKQTFGLYPRHRTALKKDQIKHTSNCGHVAGVIDPFLRAYTSAATHTLVSRTNSNKSSNKYHVEIRDYFLSEIMDKRFPNHVRFDVKRMLKLSPTDNIADCVDVGPASRTFVASEEFARHLDKFPHVRDGAASSSASSGAAVPLGEALTPEWFYYDNTERPQWRYEENLRDVMTWIVTQKEPMLAAAQACVQAEFHRTLNDLYFAKSQFNKRRMIYVSGVILDVAPSFDQMKGDDGFFPRTFFAPWSAYCQFVDEATGKQNNEIWDQERLLNELGQYPYENTHQLKLDTEMEKLPKLPAVQFPQIEVPPKGCV